MVMPVTIRCYHCGHITDTSRLLDPNGNSPSLLGDRCPVCKRDAFGPRPLPPQGSDPTARGQISREE